MSASDACLSCGAALGSALVDLGELPLSANFLTTIGLSQPQPRYPLRLMVCPECGLAQLDPAAAAPDHAAGYTFFASILPERAAWAQAFFDIVRDHYPLGPDSRVVEIGSNDGYLLRHFAGAGIPVLGIEPATNVAFAARRLGVPTEIGSFGLDLARKLRNSGQQADLIVANDVLPDRRDIGDCVAGMAHLLKPEGMICAEFPSLAGMIDGVRFERIDHERHFYFSLTSIQALLRTHGLRLFDARRVPGDPDRMLIRACHPDAKLHQQHDSVAKLLAGERNLATLGAGFAARVAAAKSGLRDFLLQARIEGKQVAAYGASAAGCMLLNICGIGGDLIRFVADPSPFRQGLFLPGSHLPVVLPEMLDEITPDHVLVLPSPQSGPLPLPWRARGVEAISFMAAHRAIAPPGAIL